MDFRYIADQRNQQLTPNKPLGTGVYQRGMEGLHENPLVWSAALQKYVPAQSQFDSLSPAEQAQYLFSQIRQFGSSSSDAPVSQRIDASVPPDVNAVNVQNIEQNNAPNASGNVDNQPPPYVPLERNSSDYLGQSLLGQLTNPRLKSQFDNLLGTSQSQPNAPRQTMAQDNSPSFMQNILGTVPSYYSGLLGAEEAKSLQSRANTQGLLGAAIGLLGGMGTRGTTAAQNIAGALGSGLQASQGAIQQGITNYGQQQQLMLQQRQQSGIAAMKLKYPDLADEFDTNPAGAFRIISEREAITKKPIVVSRGGSLVSPSGNALFTSPDNQAKGRILTPEEVTKYGLPTTGKYQFNANGEISLIQGTGLGKETKPESFTGEYGNLALRMFGTANVASLDEAQRIALGKEAERLGGGKGVNVTTNVNTGEFSKTTKGEIEKNVISSADAINRLNSIYSTYRPEYLNVPFRTKQIWSGIANKFQDLNENDKKTLAGYSSFKQNALQNLNKTIKDLTGAAMGEQEAGRIIASLPNAGTTIFDGDSPQEFESKLTNALTQTKYTLARQNYALSQGINKNAWEKISLDDMPSIVLKRENELGAKYYGDKFNKNDIAQRNTIKRQLAAEFGIPF